MQTVDKIASSSIAMKVSSIAVAIEIAGIAIAVETANIAVSIAIAVTVEMAARAFFLLLQNPAIPAFR